MLSDACSTFLDEFERAALKLARDMEWYSAPGYEAVYRDELNALRQACTRVQEAPYDDEARAELLRLTASVMRLHDA